MQCGITRLGTQVRLPDGREATVVYNSLVGVGVKFGLHDPPPEAFEGTDGNTMQDGRPEGVEVNIINQIRREEKEAWKRKYPEWINRGYVKCPICNRKYLTQPRWRYFCTSCREKRRLPVSNLREEDK